jgi:hypothetical protein
MKFLCRKELGKLVPVDEAGADAMRKIKHGSIVQIEMKQPRNVQHHRLYWALVTKVWENLPEEIYPDAETLHERLKVAAGIRTEFTLPDGTRGFIPGSIAFHKMDQAEFSAFYDRVCDLIAKHFLPGVSVEDLKAEVEQMIGARAA